MPKAQIPCKCGKTIDVEVAEGFNEGRLEVKCSSCGQRIEAYVYKANGGYVERWVYYPRR